MQEHHPDAIEMNIDTHPVKLAIGVVIGAVSLVVGIILLVQLAESLYAHRSPKDDLGMKAFDAFLAKDFPEGNRADGNVMSGYNVAQALVQVLKRCGDNLTRVNVMKQAANLKDFRTTNLLPGITINTSPIDFAPIKQLQLRRFKGERWELFGPTLSSEIGG